MKKAIIAVSIMLGLGLTQANGQEVKGGIKRLVWAWAIGFSLTP